MDIVSPSVIRQAEQELFRSGIISSSELMARVVQRLVALWNSPEAGLGCEGAWKPEAVLLYIGKGNNAGDAAGLAAALGLPIYVRQPLGESEAADTLFYLQRAEERAAVCYVSAVDSLPGNGKLLIIDGLLGSGARGMLRPPYAELVQEMNACRAANPRSLLLAVDIPTGLDAETGAVHGDAVRADVTAAIGCVKPGMTVDGAEDYVGRLLCVPLPEVHLPPSPPDAPRVTDEMLVRRWMPRRSFSCFKNRAGRVNIVAGSVGYLGAARLCAEAAVATGAGLVALYCRRDVYPLLATALTPEVMVRPVDSYADVPADGAEALVIGPGLGTPPPSEVTALHKLVQACDGTLLLDADGLNLAAAHAWEIPSRAILTPHPGEMRRLYPDAAFLSRAECCRRFVAAHPCTLLLKGARTIITDGTTTCFNSSGGPYMANGGQGDTLAGVIAALVAQGVPPVPAAAAAAYRCGQVAAYLHAQAGHCPAVPASHLISALPCFL